MPNSWFYRDDWHNKCLSIIAVNLNPDFMKKILTITLFSTLISANVFAQIYIGKTSEISFYSDGIIEDIEAKNTSTKPILNTANNEVLFKISIQGFVFAKSLMQEHFNETYMESDKFPHALFKGKINETIDWKIDGTHKVTVTGKLTIHGIEKERTMDGTATIKGGEITLETKFNVAIKDHNITVPTIVVQNIAEIVEVKIKALLFELKK